MPAEPSFNLRLWIKDVLVLERLSAYLSSADVNVLELAVFNNAPVSELLAQPDLTADMASVLILHVSASPFHSARDSESHALVMS